MPDLGQLIGHWGYLAIFVLVILGNMGIPLPEETILILAGPLAGATGLRPLAFFPANVLGAALYVPLAVGLGYAVGYGLGEYVARLERVVGEIEHLVLIGAILAALALMGWRALRAARTRRP